MTRAFIFMLFLSACTAFPKVDAVTHLNLATPSLLPLDEILAQTGQPRAGSNPLAARTAALQARANSLRAQ